MFKSALCLKEDGVQPAPAAGVLSQRRLALVLDRPGSRFYNARVSGDAARLDRLTNSDFRSMQHAMSHTPGGILLQRCADPPRAGDVALFSLSRLGLRPARRLHGLLFPRSRT